MNNSPTEIRPKDYFLSTIHVLLAFASIVAALTHLGEAFSSTAPYLPMPLRVLLVIWGIFSVASLIWPRVLRPAFFGGFGVLMLFNAVSDLTHWGWLPSLRASYVLELLAFLLCVVGLGVHRARSLARGQKIGI